MPPKDHRLRQTLEDLAALSDGALSYRTTTAAQLGQETGLALARSTNPVYVFTLTGPSSDQVTCTAFTLALDGSGRPATRAEALGRSLADSEGGLFALNPFLLVFDYTGERLLAVSAIELFDAFRRHASDTDIPYSGSASFSLTPNFGRGTIFMYADVREPTVWAASAAPDALALDDLTGFLQRVARETADKVADIPTIVQAVKARLDAAPPVAATGDVPAPGQAVGSVPVALADTDRRDDAVRIDDRLWEIILTAIASSGAVLLVGPPGTGKSALVRKAVAAISAARQGEGLPAVKTPLWATPDESWTSRELIGGETVVEGEIVFRPGWVLRAISENRWLVLDEANRGDLDRIFGALLTWLAGGDVAVGVASAGEAARVIELGWTPGPSRVETVDDADGPGAIRYLASRDDWKLLGTYNALDAQRVFRIGAALGRRFVRVPIPAIEPDEFDGILKDRDLSDDLRRRIGRLYRAHHDSEVTRVGPASFLGMCAYLASAVTMRTLSAGEPAPGVWTEADTTAPSAVGLDPRSASVEAAPAPGAAPEPDEDDLSPARTGPEASALESEVGLRTPAAAGFQALPTFTDLIASEAYLLNLGTFLSQLEEPDLDQLVHRIRASGALTEKGVAWVTKMIRALA